MKGRKGIPGKKDFQAQTLLDISSSFERLQAAEKSETAASEPKKEGF